MKRLMMIAVLLPMPLFAAEETADNPPATHDAILAEVKRARTDIKTLSDYVHSLNLGSVVGDVSAIKEVVTNQGVQVVEFQNTATVAVAGAYYPYPCPCGDRTMVHFCQEASCTVTYPHVTTTYVDRGGTIPGVVVHSIDGITLPAGTYLFRGLGDGNSDLSWRWTGAAGHATGRYEGDVVWPMTKIGVFTFASSTIIKAVWVEPSVSTIARHQWVRGDDSKQLTANGMIERLR